VTIFADVLRGSILYVWEGSKITYPIDKASRRYWSPDATVQRVKLKRLILGVDVGGVALIGQHHLDRSNVQLTDETFASRQGVAQSKLGLMSNHDQLPQSHLLDPDNHYQTLG